jgi:hypothetical protein
VEKGWKVLVKRFYCGAGRVFVGIGAGGIGGVLVASPGAIMLHPWIEVAIRIARVKNP